MKLKFCNVLFVLLFSFASLQAATLNGVVKGGKKLRKSKAIVYVTGKQIKKAEPLKNAKLDQHNMAFNPHVLPVTVGTTVEFLNSDEVRHNVYSPDKEKYNLGSWPKGDVKNYTFNQKGVYTQLCNVHPEMESFIVVLDTPYFTLTDKKGNFEIKGIPPGEYTVRVWHEKYRFKKQKIVIKDEDVKMTLNKK